MDASHSLWLFFLLTLGIIVLPGMDMAYVAGHTLQSGARAGLLALGGIVAGGVVHVLLNLSGLSALLMLLPGAFEALMWAGALYLAWIGGQMMRGAWQAWRLPPSSAAAPASAPSPAQSPWRIFVSGMANCLLNPKAYAFMLAVFPGFLRSTERGLAAQGLLLGGIIAGNQVVVYGTVLLACLGSRRWQRGDGRGMTLLSGLMGLSLVALALGTLVRAAQGLH
ncbi:LysE family translocator [Pelomonas sp. APW6]|uniref:LysE family translocator n=1 Tax=Roseateles subflavus TaxID=3053353 RepID=A0ABT7LCU9_9BURK|nr:LysE family translocator [Pelomonas sp. APW6]MDL5030677.1 LysE family translocator [Pelomonas sp. APW6]